MATSKLCKYQPFIFEEAIDYLSTTSEEFEGLYERTTALMKLNNARKTSFENNCVNQGKTIVSVNQGKAMNQEYINQGKTVFVHNYVSQGKTINQGKTILYDDQEKTLDYINQGKTILAQAYINQGKTIDDEAYVDQGKTIFVDAFVNQGKTMIADSECNQGKTILADGYINQGKTISADTFVSQGKTIDDSEYVRQGKSLSAETIVNQGKVITDNFESYISEAESINFEHIIDAANYMFPAGVDNSKDTLNRFIAMMLFKFCMPFITKYKMSIKNDCQRNEGGMLNLVY